MHTITSNLYSEYNLISGKKYGFIHRSKNTVDIIINEFDFLKFCQTKDEEYNQKLLQKYVVVELKDIDLMIR